VQTGETEIIVCLVPARVDGNRFAVEVDVAVDVTRWGGFAVLARATGSPSRRMLL
jgi:hypothetical protein